MQAYSDPKRESDPYALPDLEIFEVVNSRVDGELFVFLHDPGEPAMGLAEDGFYWCTCSPGCLPDGDPIGPFASYAEALDDAREGLDEDDGDL